MHTEAWECTWPFCQVRLTSALRSNQLGARTHTHTQAHWAPQRTQCPQHHLLFFSSFFTLSPFLNLIISVLIPLSPPLHCSAGVLTATNDTVWSPQSPQPASWGHICSISSPEHFHMEACHPCQDLTQTQCLCRKRETKTDGLKEIVGWKTREQTIRKTERERWTERKKGKGEDINRVQRERERGKEGRGTAN